MKLLYRIAVICFLACSISLLIYWILFEGLRKFEVHKTERFQHLLVDSAYHDILFLGSSKLHTGTNPRVIDSICNVDSYNAGIEGANLFESYYMLKGYLEKHKPPEYIFLSLDLFSFDLSDKIFNYTIYLNYIDNKAIKTMLAENGHPTFAYKLFPFLMLSDLDDYSRGNALKGFAGKTEILPGDFQYKGFLSNTGLTITNDTSAFVKPVDTLKIDPKASVLLNEIILNCKARNIRLVLLYCPEFKSGLQKAYVNSGQVFHFMDSTAKINGISFLRHDSLSICTDATLFANMGHLNRQGADVYSRLLAKEIQKIRGQ